MTMLDTPAPSPVPADPLAENNSLRQKIEDLTANLTRTITERDRAIADIATIGETLIEEADRRDWCSEYDDIVERLNSQLRYELPLRTREYDVEVTITASATITVRASNAEEAEDEARSEIGDYFEMNYVTYNVDDTSIDNVNVA